MAGRRLGAARYFGSMSVRAWSLFAAVSTLWGIPYLFIKIGVDGGVPPVLLAWAFDPVSPDRHGRAVRGLIVGGDHHRRGAAARALLALRFDDDERATGHRLVGLVIGLLGVVLLVGLDASGSLKSLAGAGAILLAAVGYAGGPMILKRHLVDLDPRATMGASLAVAAIVLTPPAVLDAPARSPTTGAIAAVRVLGLVCTALAFVLMAVLIAEIGPGRAVVITYVNPIIAVALGVTLLGEQPGAGAVAGLLLILAGSWLSTDGRLPPGLTAAFSRARRGNAPTSAPAESAIDPATA
jgi:drug/metabolite transporter (DMT)-like permease